METSEAASLCKVSLEDIAADLSAFTGDPDFDSTPQPNMLDTLRAVRAARFSSRLGRWAYTSNCARGIRAPLPASIRIVTWNIDFISPEPHSRLLTAIEHIQRDVLECEIASARPEPCCILFQEVNREVFETILRHEWVQNYFMIVPTTQDKWPEEALYGNVTLIARTIPVSAAYIIDFSNTEMHRNALIVDLKLCLAPPEDEQEIAPAGEIITFRVANTHLESLPEGARMRPKQLELVANALEGEEIFGGIVCGDMNSLGSAEAEIHKGVGLKDSWRGGNDDEDGYTWGYQPAVKFPPARLDKIFFTGGGGFVVEQPEKIGVDVKTSHGQWVSDHYGLVTSVHILQ